MKRQQNGDLKIFCTPDSPAIQELCSLTTINDVPVKISAPDIYKKGVIRHQEISLLTTDELQELLQDQHVAYSKKLAPDTALLHWKSSDIPDGLPRHVRLAWETLSVRPYIRRPTRYHHCQKYGHIAAVCRRRSPNCSLCTEEGHIKEDCVAEVPKCAACNGDHETTSSDCTHGNKKSK